MNLEIAAAIVGLALGLPAVLLYNRLIATRNQARQAFADIDVQLERRAELVPLLVEAVRGCAGCEKALLASVTELRSAALAASQPAERFNREIDLGSGLRKLVMLEESYPQLKADANFRDLSAKLLEVENQLQFARRFYNGAVKEYVTRLEAFPDMLVAKLFAFRPMPFFEDDARSAARVNP